MVPGTITVICFIGFFILLDIVWKVIRFLFPYVTAYSILSLFSKKQEERLDKEWEKRSEERLQEFKSSIRIVKNGEKPDWDSE